MRSILNRVLGAILWDLPLCSIESVKSCPKRLWVPRFFMTLYFMVWFIPYSIKQWRVNEEILKWEMWVPDWEETRKKVLPKSLRRMAKYYEKLEMVKQKAKSEKMRGCLQVEGSRATPQRNWSTVRCPREPGRTDIEREVRGGGL